MQHLHPRNNSQICQKMYSAYTEMIGRMAEVVQHGISDSYKTASNTFSRRAFASSWLAQSFLCASRNFDFQFAIVF